MKKIFTVLILTLFVAVSTTACSVFVKRTGKPLKVEEKKDNGLHKGQIKQEENKKK